MNVGVVLRMLLVGSLALLISCDRPRYGIESPLVGKTAPDIEGQLLDGTKLSLKDQYTSNVVLLDFWETSCGPCLVELPVLTSLAEEFKTRGVVLYAVNGGEEPELIRQFQQELQMPFKVVLDPDFKHAKAYQVGPIPQLVVIGRGGIVQEVHVGYNQRLEKQLRETLSSLVE
jgi:peroxiredoxin